MKAKEFIAYHRVSTQRQKHSGLGLEAQKDLTQSYIDSVGGELLMEFTEVESGKNNSRAKLLEALNMCAVTGATLVVAKLDRLSRELHFITMVEKSGIDFVCADMPEANGLTLHIFGAVAQHERELISKRTKEALAVAKKNGKLLGTHNPKIMAALKEANKNRDYSFKDRQAQEFAESLKVTLLPLIRRGVTQREIVATLNECNVPAARGGQWSLVQLQRVLKRIKDAA